MEARDFFFSTLEKEKFISQTINLVDINMVQVQSTSSHRLNKLYTQCQFHYLANKYNRTIIAKFKNKVTKSILQMRKEYI